MKYTVVWNPTAINRLADIYNRAADRRAVSRAADRIDRILRFDAERKGRTFHGKRLLFEPPLAVTFLVRPYDCLVEVLQVWHFQP
jgi:hypothetical protein